MPHDDLKSAPKKSWTPSIGKQLNAPIGTMTIIALTAFIFLIPVDQNWRLHSRSSSHAQTQMGTNERPLTESSSAVLLDSIVSLVQTYYVDADRVTGDQLILGTMRSLAYAIPELKFDQNRASYSLSHLEETISFNQDSEMTYDDVLGRLKALISFCDRNHIAKMMDQGESIMLGSERNPSTIILNALLSSLDAHSSLLSSEAYQDLRQGTEGSFGGLGVLVGVKNNILTVLKPLPKSPALRVGIKKNDKIISIDGFNTFGLSLDKLVPHMRGDPGSVAHLVTLRPGAWSPKSIDLRREVIELDSVQAFEVHQGDLHVLRLAIESFASRTAKEILNHLQKFKRRYPMGGVVLDLRGNPGGLLDQAVLISDVFLDHGIVVTTRGRREDVERASHTFDEVDYPLVVLMNEDSASASEIVAGALQDNGRAVVVGQPSFGKGSVQTVFELPEQRALKLTIARYFTPSQKSIQNVGIMPDVWIQPVYPATDGINLFGPYRYRNEQFLPNHLNTVAAAESGSTPTMRGYYLAHADSEESDNARSDPEMTMAMAILSKVHETYGITLPEGARRSSHWLALAMDPIKQAMAAQSLTASKWLHDHMNVVWTDDHPTDLTPSELTIEITSSSHGLEAVTGSTVEVPWRVKNNGTTTAQNVSVFIQSPVSGLETREVLVGVIPSGLERSGVMKVYIPPSMAPGRHYVSAGIAIDARAIRSIEHNFLIDVVDLPHSSLKAVAAIRDVETGADSSTIQASKRSILNVKVLNQGDVDAKKVGVKLENLAGDQLQLAQSDVAIGDIPAHGSKEIAVLIEPKNHLDVSLVNFGIGISADGLFDPSYSLVEVTTTNEKSAAGKVEALSH